MLTDEIFNVGHINCAGVRAHDPHAGGEVNGIEKVSADHRTNTVAVTHDAQRVSRKAVVDQLTDIGYAPKAP